METIAPSPNRKFFLALGIITIVFVGGFALFLGAAVLASKYLPPSETKDVSIYPPRERDWDKGWKLGVTMGQLAARAGDAVPTAETLNAAAENISAHSNNIIDKPLFNRGFYSGFAAGYKEVSKPAF